MKRNVGSADRIIRITVAVFLAYIFNSGVIQGMIGNTFLAIAGLLTLTSFFSFCPLYFIAGWTTRKS